MMHNKSIYGPDANLFRPERWFEAEGARLEQMERNNDMVFMPGRWQCPGKSIAFLELNKVFVEVSFL